MTNDSPGSFHLRERMRVLLRLAHAATDYKIRSQVLALVERLRARADELDAQDGPQPDEPRASPPATDG